MRSAERRRGIWRILGPAGLLLALAACGGGNSTETTISGNGVSGDKNGPEVAVDAPQGPNTTEIVVDKGPASGFALGVANLPYVSVKVCELGSTTACVTIDHVFLDTGSIGLRLLRSTVASLNLPAQRSGTDAVVECYPFVIGAVWGPLARADVAMAGEVAAGIPIQLIDDVEPPVAAPPADCIAAANGELLKSVGSLQAKGVLGVGMLRYDCGLACEQGAASGTTLYYACPAAGACRALAVPGDQQVQNPVSHFAQNNNGTIVVLPAVPETGASLARGRLVFGIGTQANNQLSPSAAVLHVDADPASDGYLYLSARVGSTTYPHSYIDSGSNGVFFDDPTLPTHCTGSGAGATWYCPGSVQVREVVLSDPLGVQWRVNLSIASADLLFGTSNVAFSTLAGAAGSANAGAFVWGLPFFFGRQVVTSIWGQPLSPNGPWFAVQ